MKGRSTSARSTTSTSKAPCFSAIGTNQRAKASPIRPGRVLAMITWRTGRLTASP